MGSHKMAKKRPMDSFEIFVKTITGKTASVMVNGSDTVENLKHKLQDKLGAEAEQQRIIFNSKQLEDHKTMREVGACKESVFFMIMRVSGASSSSPAEPPAPIPEPIFMANKETAWWRLMVLIQWGVGAGGYRLHIKGGRLLPPAEEGGERRVVLTPGRPFEIWLRNANPWRADASLALDGRALPGLLRLEGGSSYTLERPLCSAERFVFVLEGQAGPADGKREGAPSNGLVEVTFTPEQRIRRVQRQRVVASGFLSAKTKSYYVDEVVQEAQVQEEKEDEVEEGQEDFLAGVTVLRGHSNQVFTPTERLTMDASRRVTLRLRLVAPA